MRCHADGVKRHDDGVRYHADGIKRHADGVRRHADGGPLASRSKNKILWVAFDALSAW